MPIQNIPIAAAPRRVVSLVPSLTESFFDLGLGDHLVGITDYCIHPAALLSGLPRVGGPKNPRVDQILGLAPDLVLANQEENSPPGIDALRRAGIPVWLTFPLTLREALCDLDYLARLYGSEPAQQFVKVLASACEKFSRAGMQRASKRFFCPIWTDQTSEGERWWMTFNGQTYPSDLLATLGLRNAFSRRERLYPLAADLGKCSPEDPGPRDIRYPRVRLAEILQSDLDILLIPDEPYAFRPDEVQELKEILEAGLNHPLMVEEVNGSFLFWPGTRLGLALRALNQQFWKLP
jgi:iron complex transport system substrate-binding protein